MLGPGVIARYTTQGLQQVIDASVELPSDVTFGGPNLDRMFLVSIAVPVDGIEIKSPDAGALLSIDGTNFRGRPEPRFEL